MELSVVIPVYNEEISIKNTVNDIYEDLKDRKIDFEIIAVEDGSDDNTFNTLQNLDIPIKIIRNRKNRGYGYSLKRGIRHAIYKNIFITDADGTYPNSRMYEFLKYFYKEELDMLVGKRKKQNIPLIRKPAKWLLGLFANYISGFNIPDLNSGFRVFKKDICEKFFNLLPDGFSFTSTITLSMFSQKYSVEYIEIDYEKREGKSKINPIKDTFNFFVLVWKTVFYFAPLKTFLPLSFLFMLAGLGVFFYSYLYTEKVMDITTVVLLISSIQIFCMGLIADLIVRRGSK